MPHMKSRTAWQQAEVSTAYALRHRGVRCRNVGHLYRPWDVETRGGIRVEVKDSMLHRGLWAVNLQRHERKNVKQSSDAHSDFYVIALRGILGFKGVTHRLWIVLDAKKYRNTKFLRWTLRSLLNKHARDIGDWSKILKKEKRRAIVR